MKMYRSLFAAAVVLTCFGGHTYGVTIFEDALETHTIGDEILFQIPPVGEWGFTAVITSSQHTVQADPVEADQALRSTRLGAVGSPGFPTARTLTTVEADTVLTINWDWFREDAGVSGAVHAFYMGTNLFQDASININGTTQEIRSKNNNVTTGLGVNSGFGGWESLEMVVTFGPEDGLGQTTATYDVFFERHAGNSQGVLAKTLVVDDATINTPFDVGEGNMRWMYALDPHFNNTPEVPVDATMYFDNISIVVDSLAPTLLLGDADNSGTVTADDLIAVQQNFGNVGPNGDGTDLGDANDDGNVTADDLISVQQNFGNTLGASGGAAVPEPGTTAIMLALAVVLMRQGSGNRVASRDG